MDISCIAWLFCAIASLRRTPWPASICVCIISRRAIMPSPKRRSYLQPSHSAFAIFVTQSWIGDGLDYANEEWPIYPRHSSLNCMGRPLSSRLVSSRLSIGRRFKCRKWGGQRRNPRRGLGHMGYKTGKTTIFSLTLIQHRLGLYQSKAWLMTQNTKHLGCSAMRSPSLIFLGTYS